MLTVDDYGQIRRAYRDGMSIRKIARRFHHSRHKVREVRSGAGEPPARQPRRQQSAPQLGAFHERILQMLREDETAPPKQRHTMMRIFERLRDEHAYQGGYDAVRRFVRRHRQQHQETFIPLDHPPGRRIEADFGEIRVDVPDGRHRWLSAVTRERNNEWKTRFPAERVCAEPAFAAKSPLIHRLGR